MVMKRNRIFGNVPWCKNIESQLDDRFFFRSVGCLLYEMCTFEHAFEGKGLMNVIYKVVEGKPPELPKEYSKELNDVLKK